MVLYDNGLLDLIEIYWTLHPKQNTHFFKCTWIVLQNISYTRPLKQAQSSARGQKLNTPFSQAQQYETRNQLQKEKREK